MASIAEVVLGLYRGDWNGITLFITSILFIFIVLILLLFGGNWRKTPTIKALSMVGLIIFLLSFFTIIFIFLSVDQINKMDTGGLFFGLLLNIAIPVNLITFLLFLTAKEENHSPWFYFKKIFAIVYLIFFVTLLFFAIPIEANYQKEYRFQHTITQDQAITVAKNRINDNANLISCNAFRHDKFDGEKATDFDTWEVRCNLTEHSRVIWMKSTDGAIISDQIEDY